MKEKEITVKIIFSGWQNAQEKIEKAMSVLSDEDMDLELAPGRNSVSWVIGHLAAVNDSLYVILGFGEKTNESYYKYFIEDDFGITAPDISQIRQYWRQTSSQLNEKLQALSVEDWFGKHALVSNGDFTKEPHRNKLNVLLSRTFHIHHHYGQLVLVLKLIDK